MLRWWVGGRIADAVFMQPPRFSAAACDSEKWMLREALAGQEFYRLRAARPPRHNRIVSSSSFYLFATDRTKPVKWSKISKASGTAPVYKNSLSK